MIPSKYKIVSGSALKTIAVITMLIDHIASVLLRNCPVSFFIMGRTITLYMLMRTIGRVAFPIYCFLLVEGFLHTRDRKRYGLRLIVFALLSEIPWNLEHSGRLLYAGQNVFFTLFMGFLGMCCLERYRNEPRQMTIGVALLYIVTLLLRSDYGVTGYGYIMMLYLFREQRALQVILGSCFLSTWKAGMAFVPISFYNGQRGFIRGSLLKYAFYAFYPAHLLILYIIKLKTIGY